MNAILNYLLEASIGLCLFLLVYQILLRKETNFRLNRIFLLIAVLASVTFPLIKLNPSGSPVPSLSFTVEPSTELENYVPEDLTSTPVTPASTIAWKGVFILYGVGLVFFSILFMRRLFNMLKILKRSPIVQYSNHHLIEMNGNHSPFSFFNYIFIGNSSPLSEHEKKQIIEHERIHARLYHSIDIIVVNILGIVFWFNPLIQVYKKIFTQLHEFEADARAVENHDVDEYCSLVAKVALNSADFRLANHFSNSLTLKRIEMMRTLKQKIKGWKITIALAMIPVLFFIVACQDQAEESAATAKVVEERLAYPANVQQTLGKLKAKFPTSEFIVITPSGHNPADFKGRENSVTIIDGQYVYEANAMTTVMADKTDPASKYIILQYTTPRKSNSADGLSDVAAEEVETTGEPVYLVVEQAPTYKGGLDKLNQELNQNIRYPETARINNIEGTVFISFVVEKDGSLSSAAIVKGISKECDQEALRAVKLLNQWTSGMQNGKSVRVKFILPVKFKL